jgi:hypothetical protein
MPELFPTETTFGGEIWFVTPGPPSMTTAPFVGVPPRRYVKWTPLVVSPFTSVESGSPVSVTGVPLKEALLTEKTLALAELTCMKVAAKTAAATVDQHMFLGMIVTS